MSCTALYCCYPSESYCHTAIAIDSYIYFITLTCILLFREVSFIATGGGDGGGGGYLELETYVEKASVPLKLFFKNFLFLS